MNVVTAMAISNWPMRTTVCSDWWFGKHCDQWLVVGNDDDWRLTSTNNGHHWLVTIYHHGDMQLVITNNGGQWLVNEINGNEWLVIRNYANQWVSVRDCDDKWLIIVNNSYHCYSKWLGAIMNGHWVTTVIDDWSTMVMSNIWGE